jgi:hypothetical protein
MYRTILRSSTILAALVLALPAAAQTFDVPINTAQSTLYFELCVSGTCDDDSSSVSGYVTVELDDVDTPTQIWLHDMDLQLDHAVSLSLDWGFLGSLSATGSNVQLLYGDAGNPTGPGAVTGGVWSLANVPADPAGALAYSASGLACTALQGAGMACNDTLNLADQGTVDGDMDGTLTSVNRLVTLNTSIDITVPLDPENPGLGTFRVYGSVTGQATVPVLSCAGDSNCDDAISWRDIDFLVAAMNDNQAAWEGMFAPGAPSCPFENNDVNDDGTVNWRDIDPFVGLMNTVCP